VDRPGKLVEETGPLQFVFAVDADERGCGSRRSAAAYSDEPCRERSHLASKPWFAVTSAVGTC